MRIGIIRESMLTFPGIKADEPISQAAAKKSRPFWATTWELLWSNLSILSGRLTLA